MPLTLPNFQKSVKKPHSTDLGVVKCRHSQKTLELFTPKSNFYCRKLPPLGVRACNLNGAREMNFVINENVWVRKFQEHPSPGQWTSWIYGTVIAIDVVRGYVGSYAKRYIVRSQCVDTGIFTITGHLYFLLEIWPTCYYPPPPPIAPEDYFKRRECAVRKYSLDLLWALAEDEFQNYVYAKLIASEKILQHIWFPAVVLKWECTGDTEDSNHIEVQCLAGRDLGIHFVVNEVLPYTHETGRACRSQGDYVMKADGTLDLDPPNQCGNHTYDI